MTSSLRILVTGSIAQYPLGGMTWHYLQYVLGLARLGHDVYYVEDTGAACYDPARGELSGDCRPGVDYLAGVMARFGLGERWAFRCGLRAQWFGMAEARRRSVVGSADLLLNVSGMLERPWEYRQVRRLAYVDTDPVFNQIKLAAGPSAFGAQVDAHDVHFSFGERLGDFGALTGHKWWPTRQPVVMDQWRPSAPRRDVFATVMNWTASKNPPVFGGRTYGQKDVELLRFIDLPRRVPGVTLELAMNPGKRRRAPLEMLRSHGWQVVDPERVCVDLDSYRVYVESARAEWSVAKNGYVQGRPGWFSERSACFLAAGRPVVVQDTGLDGVLPVGEGLLTFTTPDEAAAAIDAVSRNYALHCGVSRDLAQTYFAADKVLTRVVGQAMGEDPGPDPRRSRRREGAAHA